MNWIQSPNSIEVANISAIVKCGVDVCGCDGGACKNYKTASQKSV